MEISYYRNINRNETYPADKRQIKFIFSDIEHLTVLFGLRRNFDFDSRCYKRPDIKGIVVASASYDRFRIHNHLSLYPVVKDKYPEKPREEFNTTILPRLKKWIIAQNGKPDTALLGVEELIIEWDGKTHLFHQVKFL